jgi:hypothetical protein
LKLPRRQNPTKSSRAGSARGFTGFFLGLLMLKNHWLLDLPSGLTLKVYILSTGCIYAFCNNLRINSDYFSLEHQLTDFHNRDEKNLLLGTN